MSNNDLVRCFDRLARRAGLNLVPLDQLRAATGLDRDAFEAQLLELRRADRFVLHTHDGRHGRPSESELASAIVENGRTFIYAAMRR